MSVSTCPVLATRCRRRGRRLWGLVRPCPLARKVECSDLAAREEDSKKKMIEKTRKHTRKPTRRRRRRRRLWGLVCPAALKGEGGRVRREGG